MDGILVGSRGNANTLLGNGTKNADEIKSPNMSDRRDSKSGAFDTGGGQRWSGVTVDVTEVSIVTRGWKRFTGGVDPRDVYQAAREGGARAPPPPPPPHHTLAVISAAFARVLPTMGSAAVAIPPRFTSDAAMRA